MGVTGLETAFAAVHTDLVVPGVLDLGLVVERLTAGGEPFGLHVPAAGQGPRRPTSAWWTWRRSGRWGRPATRAARPTAPSPAARLTGRVRMTIAARRRGLPRALVRDRGGRLMAASCDRDARRAGDRRRPGGLPPGACSTSSAWPTTPACSRRAPTRMGLPLVVTEQYPKGLGRTVPEVAEHLDGVRAGGEDGVLGRPRRRLRPRRPRPGADLRDRDPRVRLADGHDLLGRRASRCTWPATR